MKIIDTIRTALKNATEVTYEVRRRKHPTDFDGDVQFLIRVTRFMGYVISRQVIDSERIPADVVISLGCFGDTGGWKSKFSDYIDAQNERRLAAAA